MMLVAKRRRQQISLTLDPDNVKRLQALGERLFKSTSEMVDRAITHYMRNGAMGDISEVMKEKAEIDALLEIEPTRNRARH